MRLKLWLPILLVAAALLAVSWKVRTNPIHAVALDAANFACSGLDEFDSSSLVGLCGRVRAEWLGAEFAKARAAVLSDLATPDDAKRYTAVQTEVLDAAVSYSNRVQADLSRPLSAPAPKD